MPAPSSFSFCIALMPCLPSISMPTLAHRLCLLLLAVFLPCTALAAPSDFEQAKIESRQYVYHDRNQGAGGDLYCGCDWRWTGRSGGRMEPTSCGYSTRAQPQRAERLEWEHIVPASNFGRARQCWQQGGRGHCQQTDPVFNAMEADMHNLTPVVGEVNGDRQNFPFGPVANNQADYGACSFRIDFRQRTAEPPDSAKGLLARVYFYMHDRYNLPMSRQQARLLMTWDRQFPVDAAERERDQRIATRMGHGNPFVSGARQWSEGHRNSGEGLRDSAQGHVRRTPASSTSTASPTREAPASASSHGSTTSVRGNRRSQVYHLPQGCPGYSRMAQHNIIEFDSENAARAAGFRRAGDCR